MSTTLENNLDIKWIHGSKSRKKKTDPFIQVYHFTKTTIIMRQSKDVTYEAPFLYLFFGMDKALLLDTGAIAEEDKSPLRKIVDELITKWLTKNPKENYQLVVAHTHGHNDHTTGDSQFLGRENTTIVSKDVQSVKKHFNIEQWPSQQVTYDLGGRNLEIIPTPGHDEREISVYDYETKILVTGDLVCRGRLYVFDFQAFLESLDKLVDFCSDHEISHILGCHIEMTKTPKKDYPISAKYQPNEPPLELTVEQLKTLRDDAKEIKKKSGVHKYNDFILWINPGKASLLKLVARGIFYNFKYRFGLIKD